MNLLRRGIVSLLFSVAISWSASSLAQDDAASLYFFTSDACPPCRQVEPEIIELYEQGYPVFKVNASQQRDWTEHFSVRTTPTVILVDDGKVVARHSGLISATELRRWFASTQTIPAASDHSPSKPELSVPKNLPATYLKGTANAQSQFEQVALHATVRISVEDPEGTSFATGTIIHAHGGEALVLTCGHVFRDSQGTGPIYCEYGFGQGNELRKSKAELLFFDSEQRDIGLVAFTTSMNITPVPIASLERQIPKQLDVFSVGCDHGKPPTIRHSRIKNFAKYRNVQKYDIYGRPVVGRSGGGLFTEDGQLIGVCNAAVVDEDEGVYVGIDTIYWQLAQVNLQHLFAQPNPEMAVANSQPDSSATERRSSTPKQFAVDSYARVSPMPSAAEIRELEIRGSEIRDRSNSRGL